MAMRLSILFLLLAARMELPGCGPFIPEMLFTLSHQPEHPAQEFARGRLGVLLPGYTRDYLVVAYRYLTGAGLNDAQRAGLFPASTRVASAAGNPWLDARNKAAGIATVPSIDAYKTVKTADSYDTFLNCGDDAFRTAAATLARIAKPRLNEWIAAQDQVFDNCSGTHPANIPDANGDPDRAYQVAAARFYAGQYPEARDAFEAIARDSRSSWHSIAPYLVARCLLRQGAYDEAEQRLNRIAGDAARDLAGYARSRAHPADRMHELAEAVTRPGAPTLARDLTDYHFLLDTREPKGPYADDLTDWIYAFQNKDGARALERWRATRSQPWLVAALNTAAPGDAAAAELVAAAHAVQPDVPAYATAAFHAARLEPPDEARRTADAALATALPTSATNLFRAVRLRTARSFDEFLRFAPRKPVGEVMPVEVAEDLPGTFIDSDAAVLLNRELPLALIRQAAASPRLPPKVRNHLNDVAWVRGILLSTQPPAADDLYRLLRTPGLRPWVEPGFGRTTEAARIDDYKDNWWCAAQDPAPAGPQPTAPFLSAADKAKAAAEWAKLKSLPAAPNWLGAQTLEWAKRAPGDPRLPEALHLVVRATRFGCSDDKTTAFSKAAFQLLHRRFPSSDWTKKTPYYY